MVAGVSLTRMTIPVIDRQLDGVRRRLVEAVTSRMYGDQRPPAEQAGPDRLDNPWLPADSPVRQVHADIAMLVGGLRALLLQSLHPQAMQAVYDHSSYHDDIWGRLQRTSAFVGATTFGSVTEARHAIDKVRAIHEHIRGTGPLGPYRASDPHLLLWVHAAELDSFLAANRLYGRDRLDPQQTDIYVADMARTGEALGIERAPRSRAELDRVLADFRPDLKAGRAAAD